MDIILMKQIKNKGEAGDLVRVKQGFARNFLFPKGLAVPASKSYRNQREQLMKRLQKEREEAKKALEGTSKTLNGETITFKEKVSKGKLYGSVTPGQVAKEIKSTFNIDVKKSELIMDDHIKSIGEHEVKIDLHPDLDCKITVTILADEEVEEPTNYEEAVALDPSLEAEEATEAVAEEVTEAVAEEAATEEEATEEEATEEADSKEV